MKRTACALLAALLALGLAGCGETEETEETTEPTEEVEETVEPTEETEETADDGDTAQDGESTAVTVEAGVFTVGEADKDALAEYETLHEFTVSEEGVRIVLTPGEDVTAFTFFTVNSTAADESGTEADAADDSAGSAADDGTDSTADEAADASSEESTETSSESSAGTVAEATYTVGDTLYTLEQLAAGEPVVITLTWPEIEPGYGFSYTDADGVTYSFAISSNPEAAEGEATVTVVAM